MRVVVIAGLIAASVGCVNERVYMDPDAMAGWDDLGGGDGLALLRGDVGELRDIDNSTENMWVSQEPNAVDFSGDVPHQAREGSSVYLQVRILNPQRLQPNVELRQQGVQDAWDDANTQEPVLDVYICPNGEGVSGNADDIVVTRTGPNAFRFVATSTNVDQNLNVDLDLQSRTPPSADVDVE